MLVTLEADELTLSGWSSFFFSMKIYSHYWVTNMVCEKGIFRSLYFTQTICIVSLMFLHLILCIRLNLKWKVVYRSFITIQVSKLLKSISSLDGTECYSYLAYYYGRNLSRTLNVSDEFHYPAWILWPLLEKIKQLPRSFGAANSLM